MVCLQFVKIARARVEEDRFTNNRSKVIDLGGGFSGNSMARREATPCACRLFFLIAES